MTSSVNSGVQVSSSSFLMKQAAGNTTKSVAQSPQVFAGAPISGFELPGTYGENRIILLVREPGWVYAYWEIMEATRRTILDYLPPEKRNSVRSVVRILSLKPGWKSMHQPENRVLDIEVPYLVHSWHIDIGTEPRHVVAAFGFLTPEGHFIEVVRSNPVTVPSGKESDLTDEEWLTLEELYRFGSPAVGTSPALWMERTGERERGFVGHLPTSPGIFSPAGASPIEWAGPGQYQKPFWLKVDTELVVYGKTIPGAKVTINGEEVTTGPDGSFTARYGLDDTTLVLPVQATSADGDEQITITPVVKRETY